MLPFGDLMLPAHAIIGNMAATTIIREIRLIRCLIFFRFV
jgi:hypothetical protein